MRKKHKKKEEASETMHSVKLHFFCIAIRFTCLRVMGNVFHCRGGSRILERCC